MIVKERLFWIAAIIAVILYFTKCNQVTCPVIKEISYDTTFIPGKDSIRWKQLKPKIVIRDNIKDSSGVDMTDYAINDPVPEVGDTAAVYEDWNASRYYEDTTNFSGGTTVITLDSVNKNRLSAHRIFLLNSVPIVTKTVTYMQPKRSEIYGGLNFGYNNVGANIIFKDTSDRVWEAGVFYAGKVFYYLGKKWKIK